MTLSPLVFPGMYECMYVCACVCVCGGRGCGGGVLVLSFTQTPV
jgi:hypothetical protein